MLNNLEMRFYLVGFVLLVTVFAGGIFADGQSSNEVVNDLTINGCLSFSKARICEEGGLLVFRDMTDRDLWFLAYDFSSNTLHIGGGSSGTVDVGVNSFGNRLADFTVNGNFTLQNGDFFRVK